MAEKEKTINRKTVRIIIALFAVSLIIGTSLDLFGDKFLPVSSKNESSIFMKLRNSRIDSINPKITKKKNSSFSDDEINEAVSIIKGNFKERDIYVELINISFDETKGNQQKNRIVFCCDYLVFKDFAAYSQGIYTGWNMILERKTNNSSWEIADQGYA